MNVNIEEHIYISVGFLEKENKLHFKTNYISVKYLSKSKTNSFCPTFLKILLAKHIEYSYTVMVNKYI